MPKIRQRVGKVIKNPIMNNFFLFSCILLISMQLLFISCNNNVPRELTGVENGYDWVDMELPSGTKWATYNIGAMNQFQQGDFYAWGEIETKEIYAETNYKWGYDNHWTKYNWSDEIDVLEREDDVASIRWGGNWRMATDEDWLELSVYTTKQWVKYSQIEGLLVTSKINEQSIFLPIGGQASYETIGYDYEKEEYIYESYIAAPEKGFYWTSSKPENWRNWANDWENGGAIAYVVSEKYDGFGSSNYGTYSGMFIRAVTK